jgi:hypothetical protein
MWFPDPFRTGNVPVQEAKSFNDEPRGRKRFLVNLPEWRAASSPVITGATVLGMAAVGFGVRRLLKMWSKRRVSCSPVLEDRKIEA